MTDQLSTTTQPNPFGIDEARDLVRFAGRLTRAIRRAMEDGKINLKDIKHLFSVIPTIKPAFDGLNDVWNELRDLTSDEIAELTQVFADETGIPVTAQTELLMRQALANGSGLMSMVAAMTRIGNVDRAAQPAPTE